MTRGVQLAVTTSRLGARTRYLGRVLAVLLANPVEGLDRIRGRLELMRFGSRSVPYEPAGDWEARLHEVLGAGWPCSETASFRALWDEIASAAGGDIGHGHDADAGLARAAWCITRHAPPDSVVETGVARGLSTRVVLEALARNGKGHLWSIDFPPLLEGWHDEVGALVPGRLRTRWTYIRGASRRRLPRLLLELGGLDFFVHTSLHTEPNARFEFEEAWRALRPSGVLLADAIDRSRAFSLLVERASPHASLVAQAEGKPQVFGIAVK